jgi:hypothetical protein
MTPERLKEIRGLVESSELEDASYDWKAILRELLEHVDVLDRYTFDKVVKQSIEDHRKRMADPNRRRSYSEIIREAIVIQPMPSGALPIYDRDPVWPAIFCEHANEVPNVCPCPADCYCKTHSCAAPGDDNEKVR